MIDESALRLAWERGIKRAQQTLVDIGRLGDDAAFVAEIFVSCLTQEVDVAFDQMVVAVPVEGDRPTRRRAIAAQKKMVQRIATARRDMRRFIQNLSSQIISQENAVGDDLAQMLSNAME